MYVSNHIFESIDLLISIARLKNIKPRTSTLMSIFYGSTRRFYCNKSVEYYAILSFFKFVYPNETSRGR